MKTVLRALGSFALAAAAAQLLLGCSAAEPQHSFIVQNDSFVKDGQKVLLRSSEIEYFRIPRAYWKDRLQRLQAMGMNTIATYVAWNWHEATEGSYNFDGERDLVAFLQTAHDLGLMVLLRPGPYICGEWEFGGYPAWILTKNVTLRTFEPNYISEVDKWWEVLMSKVKPMLYSNGGPVVMLQIENEFGSYGDVSKNPADKKYMEHLVEITHSALGKDAVVLYTTDGGDKGYFKAGSLPGPSVITQGDGGWACSDSALFNPKGLNACINSEDYSGWLTHWGEKMANTSATDYGIAKHLDSGFSFSLYMGHGGSNFGFMSGANSNMPQPGTGGDKPKDKKSYMPHITSYDYDSPVSENGDHGSGPNGDKFVTIATALKKFAPTDGFPKEPAPLPRKAYGEVRLTSQADLLANLQTLAPAGPKALKTPIPMEFLGQNYGLILYEGTAAHAGSTLEIKDYPRDRAQVFVDGSYNGAIYRPEAAPMKLTTAAKTGSDIKILVENMGRINFGYGLHDVKGINTPVILDGKDAASSWKASSLPLDYKEVSSLQFATTKSCADIKGPTFFKGELNIDGAPADTWLKPKGWTKGIMWVNGFNLGRYWTTKGPQQAFFMPAPYMKTGLNEVVLLELDGAAADCAISFVDQPDFSGAAPPNTEATSSSESAIIV